MSTRTRAWPGTPTTALCAAAFLFMSGALMGCGNSDDDHEHEPSGATCPQSSELTYEGFGEGFFEQYCLRCHSSALTGDDRNGAPSDHNFDTLAGILMFADHVDEHAAAGPNATNEDMPPTSPKPTADERRRLGEWLACELERAAE